MRVSGFFIYRALVGAMGLLAGLGCSEASPTQVRQQQLSQVVGFCEEWGRLACNGLVVENCAATSAQACQSTQSEQCRQLLSGLDYNPDFADYCLETEQAAFLDARLDRAELATVTELGGRCQALNSLGLMAAETCNADIDCDPRGGLLCRRALGEERGICAAAEIAPGGFRCDELGTRCEEGFFCDGERCLALAALGDACGQDLPCAFELRCEQAECASKVSLGEPCERDDDCLSELCLSTGSGGSSLCALVLVLSAEEPLCAELR